ncbi:ATP phosphoribosyltransferase [[Eubacterium] cellulosolvens]
MLYLDIALPKGHLWEKVKATFELAGYQPRLLGQRSYTMETADPELRFSIYRAQNVGPLVEEGKYDLGITGLDWIKETRIDIQDLLDLEFGKVDIVAAIPQRYCENLEEETFQAAIKRLQQKLEKEKKKKIIVASEYENITTDFCRQEIKALPFRFIRSYGATETFIKVSDLIIDCSETGATLRENGWEIIKTLFSSTARLIANKESLKDSWKRSKIEDLVSLLKGAIDAKNMKLLKMNVPEESMENVMKILPSMKSPTISKLYGKDSSGYAVEVAIKIDKVIQLIPLLKKNGATDILELDIKKVIK